LDIAKIEKYINSNMRTSIACLALASSVTASQLQPPSMLVQLFSQQKNIVGMAEVLSKRIDDRKIAKLAQIDPATGAPGAD
jgi:hypothetical protein